MLCKNGCPKDHIILRIPLSAVVSRIRLSILITYHTIPYHSIPCRIAIYHIGIDHTIPQPKGSLCLCGLLASPRSALHPGCCLQLIKREASGPTGRWDRHGIRHGFAFMWSLGPAEIAIMETCFKREPGKGVCVGAACPAQGDCGACGLRESMSWTSLRLVAFFLVAGAEVLRPKTAFLVKDALTHKAPWLFVGHISYVKFELSAQQVRHYGQVQYRQLCR